MWRKFTPVGEICSPPRVGVENPKPCGVCGDIAYSYHFGGVCCNSCKAFFRRAVRHGAYKSFACIKDGRCEITVPSRKLCKGCRFAKCRSIGMEPGWLMTEEEKERMKAKRVAKRATSESSSAASEIGPYSPEVSKIPEYLNEEEQSVVRCMLHHIEEAIRCYPYTEDTRKGQRATHVLSQMILRCKHVLRKLPSFGSLPLQDQKILLKPAILEIFIMTGVCAYDRGTDTYFLLQYVKSDAEGSIVQVPMKVDEMKRIMSPELYELYLSFLAGMQELKADMPIVLLLDLLILFCPEREGLSDPDRIAVLQDKYAQILKKYIDWRHGRCNSSLLFPKYLSKLCDLQELSDSCTEENVHLEPGDVEEIIDKFGRVNLNPYTQFDIDHYQETRHQQAHFSTGASCDQLTLQDIIGQLDPDGSSKDCCVPDDSLLLLEDLDNSLSACSFYSSSGQHDADSKEIDKGGCTEDDGKKCCHQEHGAINTPDVREDSWFQDILNSVQVDSCPEETTIAHQDRQLVEDHDLAWIDDLFLPILKQ